MWSTLRDGWARRSDDIALSGLDPGTELTYRELDLAVGRRADLLERAAIGAGSRLGVVLPSGRELVVTVLAGLACGAEVAVFNSGWWPRELRPALEVAEPDLTVAGDELAALAREVGPTWDLADGPPAPSAADGPPSAAHRRPVGALLCFSAGAWGEPSAYGFDAAQLAGQWLAELEPLDAGATLVAGEAATAAGLRRVLRVLAAGGQVVMAERWAPPKVARRLRRGGLDRLWAGGAQLNQLAARLAASDKGPCPPLRAVEAAGGPVHRAAAEHFERLFGAPVVSTYTLTEAGGPATAGVTRRGSEHRPLDVGPARADLIVEVVGPAGAAQVGDAIGDLHLGGPALGRELVGPPASGVGRGAADDRRRLATGDVGRRDGDGHLHVVGRRRDRFECDGVEVWPQLVELVLASHPSVADVAVAPRPDPERGAFGVAVTVPADPEHPPFLEDLEPVLRELPEPWRPAAQVIAEHLPLTATGQVHRRMLAYDEAAR